MAHSYANTLKTFKAGAKTGSFYSLPALGKTLGVAAGFDPHCAGGGAAQLRRQKGD
jgi:hypothetical protein